MWQSCALVLLTLAGRSAPAGPARPAERRDDLDPLDVPFEWNGKTHTLREAPKELFSYEHEDVLDVWGSWAMEREYRRVFTPDAKVLLLVPEKDGQYPRLLRAIEVSQQVLDEIVLSDSTLPLEGRLEEFEKRERKPPDPAADQEPDFRDVIVLFEFKKQAEYESALDHIGQEYPRLQSLVNDLKKSSGFTFPWPLVGGWQESPAGVEEWSAANELTNRLTQLSITQRYGLLPRWLNLGIAWFTELLVHGTVYCFPYRDEFVSVSEHSGWDNVLKREFKKRKGPLLVSDLAACKKTFDSSCAGKSWGVVAFLQYHYPGKLPLLLEKMKEKKEERWPAGTMVPEEEDVVSPPDQAGIVEGLTSPEVWEHIADFFRKGDKYKLPE